MRSSYDNLVYYSQKFIEEHTLTQGTVLCVELFR